MLRSLGNSGLNRSSPQAVPGSLAIRIGERSPECEGVEWEGDVDTPVEGAEFVGQNAVGPGGRIRYERHGTVLRAEPGKAFSFVTEEGGRPSTEWHYTFEDLGDGRTRVTEGYRVQWIPTWARILDVATNRHKDLLKGMRTTLANLKATAEPGTDDHGRTGPVRPTVT